MRSVWGESGGGRVGLGSYRAGPPGAGLRNPIKHLQTCDSFNPAGMVTCSQK